MYPFKKVVYVKTKSAAPTTVREMLSLEFLKSLGMSAYELSNKIDISYERMVNILKSESSITEKACLSLSDRFNKDIYFWWNPHKNHNNWMHSKFISLRE